MRKRMWRLAFTEPLRGTTNGNNTTQSPSNAAGGLLEVRHIAHPWLGYEGTYSFNRANQTYVVTHLRSCPVAT